jgi:VIT1/CCC1 family predicted Fe2+/Mn2+ transporter
MGKNLKRFEQEMTSSVQKLNWLRASVLGANDGIVSIAGLVMGVAAATNSSSVILTAGLAGIVAGAISMAAGEYISVSSSRDTERALLLFEHEELKKFPKLELKELELLYRNKGLSQRTAKLVATELSATDAFAAHAQIELNIDPNNLTNAWQAAISSASAFLVGAIIPLVAIILSPAPLKVVITFISVVVALAITGILSAKVGGANIVKATTRVILGGVVAMTVTYFIGKLFAVSGV